MSNELSFRARVERQARTKAKSRAQSFSPVELQIDLVTRLELPVTLALLLRDNGLELAHAHAVVTKLADEQSVLVTVRPHNLEEFLTRLSDLRLVFKVQAQAHAV